MSTLWFVTHADVVIDPKVPVPEWGLSDRGRARHRRFAERVVPPTALFASDEQKARDGAEEMAAVWGMGFETRAALGENDRSATGYLPMDAFEAMADAFFANPEASVRGWEPAVDAQARIVAAVCDVVRSAPQGNVMVVAHGGVGALFRAHVLRQPIDRSHDQPPGSGGFVLQVRIPEWQLVQDWTDLDNFPETGRNES